jgi:hypothetical protein
MKNLISFLTQILSTNKINSSGALDDKRSEIEKQKDYLSIELSALSAIPFQHSKIISLPMPIHDQKQSQSCVAHSILSQLQYENIIPENDVSRLRLYRKRNNYSEAGMNGVDAYKKVLTGISNDLLTPPNATEAYANSLPLVIGNPPKNKFTYYQHKDENGNILFDSIINDIANGKSVEIFIYSSYNEWSQEYVTVKENVTLYTAPIRHAVCLIANGDFNENGKNWLTVHDSAKFGGTFLRYIDENFLRNRCYFSAKVLKENEIISQPVDVICPPDKICEFGNRGNAVLNLQKFLASKKYLAASNCTGYYGSLTARAVLKFQLERWQSFSCGVLGLVDNSGKYWGIESIKVI